MIDAKTYKQRRDALRAACSGGFILLPGHRLQPRNYPDNPQPFRQSSHMLYACGLSRPGLVLLMGPSGEEDRLFGPAEDVDDVIWHGSHEGLEEAARRAGIPGVRPLEEAGDVLADLQRRGAGLHYLVPVQAELRVWLAGLLGRSLSELQQGASEALRERLVALRAVKSPDEVAEIEQALEVTALMHRRAMEVTRPGLREAQVAAAVQEVALARDRAQAYPPIVTVRGEVLHNNTYANPLEEGQLLLNDSGAESPLGYASDITRTFPVTGRFSPEQRRIYEVVLRAQEGAIAHLRPGMRFADVHLHACRLVAEGLAELGLMKGRPEDAVEAGAHALFFPHGVGHMLGLDVHDMEDLGDVVGYPGGEPRSSQFGLSALRMARPLEPGFVFTVEPGIYVIPALIDRWKEEGRHREFIDYERVDGLRGFGGIRIEDDVLCTPEGAQVLGPPIPKRVEELEAAAA